MSESFFEKLREFDLTEATDGCRVAVRYKGDSLDSNVRVLHYIAGPDHNQVVFHNDICGFVLLDIRHSNEWRMYPTCVIEDVPVYREDMVMCGHKEFKINSYELTDLDFVEITNDTGTTYAPVHKLSLKKKVQKKGYLPIFRNGNIGGVLCSSREDVESMYGIVSAPIAEVTWEE